MMKRTTGVAALTFAALLSIAPVQSASADVLGGIIGGAAGGILGNQIGKGSGKVVATVAGAAIGYGVGDYLSGDDYERPRPVKRTRVYEPRRVIYDEPRDVYEPPRRVVYEHAEPRTVVYKTTVIKPRTVVYKTSKPKVVIVERDRSYKTKKVVRKTTTTTTVVRRSSW